MRKLNKNTPIAFYVGLVLLCATLISFSLTGGLFARYTTSASASDSARVARFDVTFLDVTENAMVLNSYDPTKLSASTEFTISSNSEVAISYGVIIELPQSLPEYVTITVDGTTATGVDALSKVFTFDELGSFAPGENEATHTVTFEVDPAWQEADLSYSEVSVRVYAEQIN